MPGSFRPATRRLWPHCLHWAAGHRGELAAIGARARADLNALMTDTLNGGRQYLQAFRELTRG